MGRARFEGRVTLRLRMIPDEWAVEHGYAQLIPGSGYKSRLIRRWNSGINKDRVIFHYLYGKPPPPDRDGEYEAQYAYPRGAGRTRGEQLETARRLAHERIRQVAA